MFSSSQPDGNQLIGSVSRGDVLSRRFKKPLHFKTATSPHLRPNILSNTLGLNGCRLRYEAKSYHGKVIHLLICEKKKAKETMAVIWDFARG